MKKIIFFLLIAVIGAVFVFSQSQGQTMYVSVKSTEVKSSSGAFADKKGDLKLGDIVTIIKVSGNWAEVRVSNALSGWVILSGLSSKRVTGSGMSSSAGEIALAGKGFSPETEIEYRKESKLDFSGVDRMESISIPGSDLLKFIDDGRLAKGK